ncbi:hypothetical protein Btru_058576 [Bulinus truncatus]|nr:hypothetical protein Btru_058576 [Bulinus truncatus]
MRYKLVNTLISTVWKTIFIFSVVFIEAVVGGKCYKDESIGDNDGNVYYCNAVGLTRCCTEKGERTCCVEIAEKNWKEQLQLWGIVAGMIVLIAILFICCKNDISFCNSEMTLKERCYRCRKGSWKLMGFGFAEKIKDGKTNALRFTWYCQSK